MDSYFDIPNFENRRQFCKGTTSEVFLTLTCSSLFMTFVVAFRIAKDHNDHVTQRYRDKGGNPCL